MLGSRVIKDEIKASTILLTICFRLKRYRVLLVLQQPVTSSTFMTVRTDKVDEQARGCASAQYTPCQCTASLDGAKAEFIPQGQRLVEFDLMYSRRSGGGASSFGGFGLGQDEPRLPLTPAFGTVGGAGTAGVLMMHQSSTSSSVQFCSRWAARLEAVSGVSASFVETTLHSMRRTLFRFTDHRGCLASTACTSKVPRSANCAVLALICKEFEKGGC